MPFDGDINIDMPSTRELAGAMTQVPMNVSEAYRGDAYDPKSIVTPPAKMSQPEVPSMNQADDLDMIPGGLADNKKQTDFDPNALMAGIKVELEHTSNPNIAREIAMDHLTEDPNYYQKLKTIESSRIINLKQYFANPSNILKRAISNKYTGTIDATINDELVSLASELEKFIGETIGEDLAKGLVLYDTPQGIESTLKLVNKYKNHNGAAKSSTIDERFYQLSKILVESKVK
jgi:hypothetical protein